MTTVKARRSLTTIRDLTDAGLVGQHVAPTLAAVAQKYAVAITPDIAGLINTDDPADPIARQFVPTVGELKVLNAETDDPISDHPNSPASGIVHRYRNRALLKIVSVCPVYCRFCFRREMVGPGHGGTLDGPALEVALDYIRHHDEIEEVIMTGGDPLVLSPRRIRELTRALSAIPHVHKLRWHSRVPVVAPNRITPALCSALMDTDRTVRVAIHANHAREFTNPARGAMRLMHEHAIALLSQSVLLRGVNDDVETMAALLTAYSEAGVKSYYLHHGDLAPGTSHFRTTIAHGMELMSALAAAIPRSLLPTYVLDLPGGHGKIPITAANFTRQPDGAYAVRTPNTQPIVYRDVV